jgi:hypothetical protein
MATYDYDPPSEASMTSELSEVLGAENARLLIDLACSQLRLARPADEPQELIEIADTLMTIADLLRVAARSTKVRAITHRAIARSALG